MTKRERLYSIYRNMKSRCFLSTFSRYKYYGGRGISICKEWIGDNGFSNFYNWALNNGYANDLTIDRLDVDKDYSPENCRWVDMTVQNNNTRRNHYCTYNGETKSISQWAKIYNIHRCVLNNRIRRGWDFEEAVSNPTHRYTNCRRKRKI